MEEAPHPKPRPKSKPSKSKPESQTKGKSSSAVSPAAVRTSPFLTPKTSKKSSGNKVAQGKAVSEPDRDDSLDDPRRIYDQGDVEASHAASSPHKSIVQPV